MEDDDTFFEDAIAQIWSAIRQAPLPIRIAILVMTFAAPVAAMAAIALILALIGKLT